MLDVATAMLYPANDKAAFISGVCIEAMERAACDPMPPRAPQQVQPCSQPVLFRRIRITSCLDA